jgi:ATP-dependent helicase HrpB
MLKRIMQPLPIDEVLPRLHAALAESRRVVLSAPPGAGKTTRVPTALQTAPWLGEGKILMLEPRRLAARRAAEYLAAQLGEEVGETVGYRMRGESRVGGRTRIEVVTEGILTRMLQQAQDLPGVGLVIFDEFHERSIHADLGLALTLDIQSHIRPDLRILVMSATLDGLSLAAALGNAPIVESAGRLFPVETRYAAFGSDKPITVRIVDVVMRAIDIEEGDILVFLPGRGEIRRAEQLLWEQSLPEEVVVHTLYGEAPYAAQAAALAPTMPGKRKIILATNVAETSLTIEGVRVVIDSGLVRVARFDPRRGMSGLVTVPVSKASADQRRGRAGRMQPGVCYRLWTEQEHANLADYAQPEIKSTDLTPLALELEIWGSPQGEGLVFLDPPPRANLLQAREVLTGLGALDISGKLTTAGRAMAGLPVHPRLSAMILKAKEIGLGSQACDLAAFLEERDPSAGRDEAEIDLASRRHTLMTARNGARTRILEQAQRLRRLAEIENRQNVDESPGTLLALAYPERVARRRGADTNKYTMASGTIAVVPAASPLSRQEYLAIGDVDGIGAEVRVRLGAPVDQETLERIFGDRILVEEEIRWNPGGGAVVARRVERLGALVLAERSLDRSHSNVARELAAGVRQLGLESLPWTKETRSFLNRSEWLRKSGFVGSGWPDLSQETLLATLEEWLLSFLDGKWKKEHLALLDLHTVLNARFSYDQLQKLEHLAPSHLKLPSGSRVPLDYGSGDQPVLGVRLQELFGQSETPRVAGGKALVLLHLQSPARRPLAVTQDLQSFWATVYPEIRTQMRARYPRHYWPEDPRNAQPTSRTIKRK